MILDTNALSAFAEGDRDLQKVFEHAADLYLPSIVLGEYLFGIRQSKQRAIYESWLDTSLRLFKGLNVGRATASAYADIRKQLKNAGTPIPENDVWICALAQEHSMPVISRDKHLQLVISIKVLKW